MRTPILAAALAIVAAPAFAAALEPSDAWVRLPAVAGRPAAGYLMVTGGEKAATIVGISSPSATRAELHQTRMTGGLMKMSPLPRLTISKGETVMFSPGGKHVMLFGLDPRIRPGATVRLDLKLADGSTVPVSARAVGAADAPPTEHQHHH